jgi:hypothetical protein
VRCSAQHFERNASAHGMSRRGEFIAGFSQHMLRHGGDRRESAKRHDAYIGDIAQALGNVGPNGFIAQKSREEQEALLQGDGS